MDRTFLFPILALATAFALSGCERGGVSFRNGENYFVRNDVRQIPDFITSDQERDSVLGMAATMFSIATPIDFDNEVAVPVALPETNVYTDLEIASLHVEGGALVVSCDVKRGDTVSYTMRPLAVAIVKRSDIQGVSEVRVEGLD